jgi:DNA replication protein DnaC
MPQTTIDKVRPWFDAWSLVGNETKEERATLELMRESAVVFLAEIVEGAPPRWLSLVGKSGVGKTFLAKRVAEFIARYGETMYNRHHRPKIDPESRDYLSSYIYAQEGRVFTDWGKIIEDARNREFNRYQRACKDHYKILDDLGTNSAGADGKMTPFATQTMAEILNRRLSRWTMITSNFTKAQFATDFDVRIASRLMRDRNVTLPREDGKDTPMIDAAINAAAGIARSYFEAMEQFNKKTEAHDG